MNLAGIAPFIIVVVVVGAMLLSGRGVSSPAGDLDEDERRRDPSNWIGPFYRNPNDPNLFVVKRYGIGRTVNLARPLGILLILAPLVLAVVLWVVANR